MGRHAHPKATRTLLITSQTEASQNPSQHSATNTLDLADVDVSDSKMFPRVARSRDGLVQAVFSRRALSLIFRSVEWLLINLQTIKAVGHIRRGSLDSHQIARFPFPGRKALSLIFRSVEWLLIHLQTMNSVGYVRRGSLDSHQIVRFPYQVASERDCLGGRNPRQGKI